MGDEMNDQIEQIEAAMGQPVLVHRDERYNGTAFTAFVDDFTAQVRRGFDASTEDGAVSGLLEALVRIYPDRFAPISSIAAE
jgi:hypothetical protein